MKQIFGLRKYTCASISRGSLCKNSPDQPNCTWVKEVTYVAPINGAPWGCNFIFKYKIRIKNVFFTYKDVFLAKKYVFYFLQDLKIFENFLKIRKHFEKMSNK